MLLIPSDLRQYARSLIAMALFASNLFFHTDTGVAGYFHVQKAPPLLLQTWSLAVEEQFYIVLPPALLVLHRFARRSVVPMLSVTIALSFAASVLLLRRSPTDAFYLIAPRAWELLVGSLLALVRLPTIKATALREVLGVAALGMIACAMFLYTKDTPFPGTAALLPCAGAWTLIAVGGMGPLSVKTALSLPPLRFVGRISYSLYLWHWPILAVIKALAFDQLTLTTTLVALALSFAAAVLSYLYVETPFRQRRLAPTRKRLTAFAFGATACLLAFGGAILVGDGLPDRFAPATQAIIAGNLARETENAGDAACDNYQTDPHKLADLKQCPLNHGEARNILFWGDSHMGEMRPAIARLYKDGALGGRGATFALAPACPASLSMDHGVPRLHCDDLTKLALERARQPDIDTVFIYFTGWRLSEDNDLCLVSETACTPLPKEEALRIYARELGGYVRALHALGKHVILGLPDPSYNRPIPRLEILRATLPHLEIARPLRRFDFMPARETITAVARQTGTVLFDPRQAICAKDVCPFERDGVSLYVDDNHIAQPLIIPMFEAGLRTALRDSVTNTTEER